MKKETIDEPERWLRQAEKDLSDADYLFQGQRYNSCCFLCQQSAEKALKAFLYARGAERVYGHSVAELCREASSLDDDFSRLKPEISPLDVFYIPTRYPNGLPGGIPAEAFGEAEAVKALSMARKTIALIRQKLAFPL